MSDFKDAMDYQNWTITQLKNQRDELRDLVRRLLMLRRGDIAVPMDMEKQILAEARAAIGEW